MKTININIELNELDYPQLFELNEEHISKILHKIIKTGYNLYYPNIDNTKNITNNNTNIMQHKFEAIDGLINKLTGISNNSKKIGIFGENYIQELISNNFIGMIYQNTGEIDHTGDGLLTFNNGSEVLVEIKNYTTVINDDEINKFTNDMKTTKRKYGLFISISSKIHKTKIIDLKTFTYENETYYQFYISQLNDDLHRLEVAILVLQLLTEYKNPKNKEILLDENIKNKLHELVNQINDNEKLRGYFLDTEKDIRNSLNNFYQKLRDNHMDMEHKIKNIFTYLKDNNITNTPEEPKIHKLLEIHKTNKKIYTILKKILDYLHIHKILYVDTEKDIKISNIGTIKIYKEKIVLNTNTKLTLAINDDNWELFEKQFNL